MNQRCIRNLCKSLQRRTTGVASRLTDEAHLAGAVARIFTRTVIANCHVDNDCVFLQCVATEKWSCSIMLKKSSTWFNGWIALKFCLCISKFFGNAKNNVDFPCWAAWSMVQSPHGSKKCDTGMAWRRHISTTSQHLNGPEPWNRKSNRIGCHAPCTPILGDSKLERSQSRTLRLDEVIHYDALLPPMLLSELLEEIGPKSNSR